MKDDIKKLASELIAKSKKAAADAKRAEDGGLRTAGAQLSSAASVYEECAEALRDLAKTTPEPVKDERLILRLTLDVHYKPYGTPVEDLKTQLRELVKFGANHGMLSGETNAEAKQWDTRVDEVKSMIGDEAATLDEIKDDMFRRFRAVIGEVDAKISADEAARVAAVGEVYVVDQMVAMLNKALKIDPAAMHNLFRHHTECSAALDRETPIVATPGGHIGQEGDRLAFGALGVINGLLCSWTKKYRIVAVWDANPVTQPYAHIERFELLEL